VTLRGKKAGQLDFEYQISVGKNNNDILVSWAVRTPPASPPMWWTWTTSYRTIARLGGSPDRWTSLGARSRNREYYDLAEVIGLISPRMYEVITSSKTWTQAIAVDGACDRLEGGIEV